MNRTLVFATALAAGLATTNLIAQAPAAAAAPAAVAPQAIPAKVAIVAFEQAVVATNEGQRAMADLQKKYEPQKTKLEGQGKELDSLKAQLNALPANAPDDQRAKLIKDIDAREKQLNFDADAAQTAYEKAKVDIDRAIGETLDRTGVSIDDAKTGVVTH